MTGPAPIEARVLDLVGRAMGRFSMLRPGNRVAVGVSGGKDSLCLLAALVAYRARAPFGYELVAVTIEQGKFTSAIGALEAQIRRIGVEWVVREEPATLRLVRDGIVHGCDVCSRYRRRAVYEIARGLGANVIAFGHTADDFCEALLRNTLFTGRLSALPAVTHSRDREFRLIRPLLFVTEDITAAYAESLGAPLVPCGCSDRTGTVRRSLRQIFSELEQEYPHLKENILSAMGNVDTRRLLDTRFLDPDASEEPAAEHFPIVTES